MRSHVLAQLWLARERLAAQVTREFARKVDGAVLFEAAALLERLAANVANARADLGKVAEAVVAKVGPLAERLAADVARLRALSANRHHTPPISSLAASVSRAACLFHRDAMCASPIIADNSTVIVCRLAHYTFEKISLQLFLRASSRTKNFDPTISLFTLSEKKLLHYLASCGVFVVFLRFSLQLTF